MPPVVPVTTENYAHLQAFAGAPASSAYVHRLLFGDRRRAGIRIFGPAVPPTPVTGESYAHLQAFSGEPSSSTYVHRAAFGEE